MNGWRCTAARYSGEAAAPPDITHTLADAHAAIAHLKAALWTQSVAVDGVFGDTAPPPGAALAALLPPIPALDPAAAAAAFAQLPVTAVPGPARTLPPGSRKPYTPNALFTGRDTELCTVAAALAAGDANVLSTGIGGVGKTSLAIEAAWRYAPHFLGGVFWVNCADPLNIPGEIAQRGGADGMCLAGIGSLSLDDQVRLVRAEWARDLPRLLIFDNCEDPALFQQYRPLGGATPPPRWMIPPRRARWQTRLPTAHLR